VSSNHSAALFTHSQLFNETFTFSAKSCCCNDTFAIYITASKERLTRIKIIFRHLESKFHQLCYLKVLFKLVNSSKSYARKQNGMFSFRTHCITQTEYDTKNAEPVLSTPSPRLLRRWRSTSNRELSNHSKWSSLEHYNVSNRETYHITPKPKLKITCSSWSMKLCCTGHG